MQQHQLHLHQQASNLEIDDDDDDDDDDTVWDTVDLHRGRDYLNPEDGVGIDDLSPYVKHRLNQARRLAMSCARYQA